MSKKIWIVLCEGDTDRIFLEHIHRNFENSKVVIEIYSGDFLTDFKNDINESNVIKKLNAEYSSRITALKSKKQIRTRDVEKLIYMTDTDKCFENRNPKSRLLKKIASKNVMRIKQINYCFQVLLMSNDLEHVVADYNRFEEDIDLDVKLKYKMVDNFITTYDSKDKLLAFFNNEDVFKCRNYFEFLTNIDTYKKRCTNLNTIYEIE